MKQNVFQYAANCEARFEMVLADLGNYERKTTFYSDLSIAEFYGTESVMDTYRRVMKEWLPNIVYITEFVLCLNHKSWEWHANGDSEMTSLYVDLYRKAVNEVLNHYKGDNEALGYYYQVTD